jgi:hypothetical protein
MLHSVLPPRGTPPRAWRETRGCTPRGGSRVGHRRCRDGRLRRGFRQTARQVLNPPRTQAQPHCQRPERARGPDPRGDTPARGGIRGEGNQLMTPLQRRAHAVRRSSWKSVPRFQVVRSHRPTSSAERAPGAGHDRQTPAGAIETHPRGNHVGIEHGEQGLEGPGPRHGEKGVDHPRLARDVSNRRGGGLLHPAPGSARQLPGCHRHAARNWFARPSEDSFSIQFPSAPSAAKKSGGSWPLSGPRYDSRTPFADYSAVTITVPDMMARPWMVQ